MSNINATDNRPISRMLSEFYPVENLNLISYRASCFYAVRQSYFQVWCLNCFLFVFSIESFQFHEWPSPAYPRTIALWMVKLLVSHVTRVSQKTHGCSRIVRFSWWYVSPNELLLVNWSTGIDLVSDLDRGRVWPLWLSNRSNVFSSCEMTFEKSKEFHFIICHIWYVTYKNCQITMISWCGRFWFS